MNDGCNKFKRDKNYMLVSSGAGRVWPAERTSHKRLPNLFATIDDYSH